MTGDLNAIFGHCPIYIRGEAATFTPNSSFLISHPSEAFHRIQEAARPSD
ncbi:hypothetical protein I3400192H8_20580 [Dialister sp. i34-0019-2H8]